MNHTAAQYLHPGGMFTYITSFAVAEQATDIHFCTWFSKWKIRWPEPDLNIPAKQFLYKEIQGLFEVGKRNMFIYI